MNGFDAARSGVAQQLSRTGRGDSASNNLGRSYLIAAIILAVLAVAARLAILRATHSTTEDFFITLRYAENIARGRGFTYNPGERVLGSTTQLYTLYLALVTKLGLNAITAGKLANIFADGVTVYLLARMLAALGRPRVGLAAALLYATASTPINFSIGGMETGLVTLTGLCAVCAYFLRRPALLSASLGILFLLRIDGLLLGAILIAAWIIRERSMGLRDGKTLVWLFAPGILIALPWLIFSWAYFGSPIPVSMVAKVIVYGRMFPQQLPNLPTLQTQFFAGAPQIVLTIACAAGMAGLIRRKALIPAAIWMVVYYAAMLVTKVIAFGWYFMPPLPIFYALAALGIGEAVRAVAPRLVELLAPNRLFFTGLIVVSLGLIWHLRSVSRDISLAQKTEDTVRLPIAYWLRDHADPADRLLLEPIGYIGYYSRLRILDMVGLVSPEVLPSYAKSVPNPLGAMILQFRPELLLLRPSEAESVRSISANTGRPLLGGEYACIKSFEPTDGHGVAFLLYQRHP